MYWSYYTYWMISIKIHHTVFFYYYTTLSIIRTGWKISLHLQIYVSTGWSKKMGWNIYKTSTYNRNLRVATGHILKSKQIYRCTLDTIEEFFSNLRIKPWVNWMEICKHFLTKKGLWPINAWFGIKVWSLGPILVNKVLQKWQ